MGITELSVPLAQLGESPVWHSSKNTVYWADLLTPVVHSYDCTAGEHQSWEMPARIGCIALRDERSLWLAMGDGVYTCQLSDMQPKQVAKILQSGFRMNDGKCDVKGRFWFGSVGPDPHQAVGEFYCMDLDGSVRVVADKYHIPNGIGWSLDQTVMYHCDSLGRTIYRYDFDIEKGEISNRHVFYKEQSDSEPDGMAVDQCGNLWVAQWNGWRLDCFSPQGNKLRSIDMPVQRPTSCAFNDDFSTLFITSCSQADAGEKVLSAPSGGVFEYKNQG